MSGFAATTTYLYSNYFLGPEIARAPRSDDAAWVRDYTTTPSGLTGTGANPFGNATTFHDPSGKWLVFMTSQNGLWRYVEP